MNIKQIAQTVRYLHPVQILYQIRKRLRKPHFQDEVPAISYPSQDRLPHREVEWLASDKVIDSDHRFTFIHQSAPFISWNDTEGGMLRLYNLGYMDYLMQDNLSYEERAGWIDRFVADRPQITHALDAYPTSLRVMNWVRFITLFRQEIEPERWHRWHRSLLQQLVHLEKNLEYHLLGNHILENAFALYFVSLYIGDTPRIKRSSQLLIKELRRQTLPDGAHFEQSPMYHAILLGRLLDCIQMAQLTQVPISDTTYVLLTEKATAMLGHLSSVIWADGSLPLLNDSAQDIAAPASELLRYARRLGLHNHQPLPLGASGIRRMENSRYELRTTDGSITASYQPGHTHAHALHYLLRVDGKPWVVDTGISTYEKNSRRAYERSTPAHNTVTIRRTNTADVWGGFRVGKRPKISYLHQDEKSLCICHNGLPHKATHTRTWEMDHQSLTIHDQLSTSQEAESFIHLAPEVEIWDVSPSEVRTSHGTIALLGASRVEIIATQVASTYHSLRENSTLVCTFRQTMSYRFQS